MTKSIFEGQRALFKAKTTNSICGWLKGEIYEFERNTDGAWVVELKKGTKLTYSHHHMNMIFEKIEIIK